jgi:hypothetical protein|eukprot:7147050-Prymnesium_polylepis.1
MYETSMFVAGAEVSALVGSTVYGSSGSPYASAKEDDDWWRQFNNVLSSSDAVHFIAGRTPLRLVSLDPIDISGYTVSTHH